MFDRLSRTLDSMKDKAMETSARALVNRKIEKFGSVTRLEIDSTTKTIYLEAQLKGESMPVSVKLLSYEITEQDGQVYISAPRIEASREWLQAALHEYVAGRRFPLPQAARLAL
jgi:hypothetical protein